ncbi:MAG: TetR/AcrR family transcriptional regulator [Acidimicrobiales bacterium]
MSWLREDRTELAVGRILSAAGEAFADDGVEGTTMADIARRAGCSRATLYSYFANRDSLRAAFFGQAAIGLAQEAQHHVADIDDPARRIVEAILFTVDRVRATPILFARFGQGQLAATATVANSAELLDEISVGFVGGIDPSLVSDRLLARWIVRAIMSLLTLPAADAAEERALIERLVAPGLISTPQPASAG